MPINPTNYISKFASALSLGAKTQTIANGLIHKAQKAGLTSGKSPKGVAASALYTACLMCGEKRTQSQVADVTGVTEVTIRNGYKEFYDELKLKKEIEKGKKIFKVAKEGREMASAEA